MRHAILFFFATCLTAQPSFEVASVRPHRGNSLRSGPLTVTSGLIRLEGYTVFGLVLDAYGIKDYQLSFGKLLRPEDVYDDRYDIAGRAPGEGVPALQDVRVMLQGLLADRFQLRTHVETKPRPVYALQVGKKGLRASVSKNPGNCTVRSSLSPDGRNNEEIYTGCTMDRLAERLGNLMGDRPVIDRTGLPGRYDFRLVAIPSYRTRGGNEAADIPPMDAVRELGLTLTPTTAPIEIRVVDSIEKPSAN